jgi:hypothetical protein
MTESPNGETKDTVMAGQEHAETAGNPAKAGRDRLVKLGFLAVTILVVVLVYMNQRNPPTLPNWSQDLPGTLARGRAENRKTLVLFLPMTLRERQRTWLVGNTIDKNEGLIDRQSILRVKVSVGEIGQCEPAVRYGIKVIPTILLLGADGKEIGRLQGEGPEGMIAQTVFTDFLRDANSRAR